MMHIVHLIQRRHPEHATQILVVIATMSALLLAGGIWMLVR